MKKNEIPIEKIKHDSIKIEIFGVSKMNENWKKI